MFLRVLRLSAILFPLAPSIFTGDCGDKQDKPKPVPPRIAKAWRDAGVRVGSMRISKDFDAADYIQDDKAPASEMPAFEYGSPSCVPLREQPPWKAGVLVKLPDPGVPFALEMWGQPLKDAGLKELAHFESMRMLNLSITLVSDDGMKELAALKNLQSLSLGHTAVTDAGLKRLAGLTKLRSLDLGGTKVTDAGLESLAGMKNLERLDLSGAKITDAGLEKLAGLKNLVVS